MGTDKDTWQASYAGLRTNTGVAMFFATSRGKKEALEHSLSGNEYEKAELQSTKKSGQTARV
jgi:hypothetical protein